MTRIPTCCIVIDTSNLEAVNKVQEEECVVSPQGKALHDEKVQKLPPICRLLLLAKLPVQELLHFWLLSLACRALSRDEHRNC